MGYDFDKTHELILESAMAQFKAQGFNGASIRQICKDAGVTNGAFYSHFESKEDLFEKLVEPVIEGLYQLYAEEGMNYKAINSKKAFEKLLDKSFESDKVLIRYIYEHEDIFRLLTGSSVGTKYESFAKKLAEKETEATLQFLEECRPFIKKTENINKIVFTGIGRFIISTVFESFLNGNSEEETLRLAGLASEFSIAGIRDILGL